MLIGHNKQGIWQSSTNIAKLKLRVNKSCIVRKSYLRGSFCHEAVKSSSSVNVIEKINIEHTIAVVFCGRIV